MATVEHEQLSFSERLEELADRIGAQIAASAPPAAPPGTRALTSIDGRVVLIPAAELPGLAPLTADGRCACHACATARDSVIPPDRGDDWDESLGLARVVDPRPAAIVPGVA